jgi:hypothetical protein
MLNADAITGTGIFFVIRRKDGMKDGMKETGRLLVTALWLIVACVGRTLGLILMLLKNLIVKRR